MCVWDAFGKFKCSGHDGAVCSNGACGGAPVEHFSQNQRWQDKISIKKASSSPSRGKWSDVIGSGSSSQGLSRFAKKDDVVRGPVEGFCGCASVAHAAPVAFDLP